MLPSAASIVRRSFLFRPLMSSAALSPRHPKSRATGTFGCIRPGRPATISHRVRSRACGGRPDTAAAGPASFPGSAGTAPRARGADRPRRPPRRRRPGPQAPGASLPGRVRQGHARRGPAAGPRPPTRTAGPTWRPRHAGRGRAEYLVHQASRAAELKERLMGRLDAPGPAAPPADTLGIAVRDPQLIAVGPGKLMDADQVQQRVRLVPEQIQDTSGRPVTPCRVQGDVPGAELDHARAGDHRGLADGGQDMPVRRRSRALASHWPNW